MKPEIERQWFDKMRKAADEGENSVAVEEAKKTLQKMDLGFSDPLLSPENQKQRPAGNLPKLAIKKITGKPFEEGPRDWFRKWQDEHQ